MLVAILSRIDLDVALAFWNVDDLLFKNRSTYWKYENAYTQSGAKTSRK